MFGINNFITWSSGIFTIDGGLTTSVRILPFQVGEIITAFQPSVVLHLAPVPSGVSYTIQRNGSWVWRDNNQGIVFPGVGLVPTSWPADASVIGFNFSDGTPAEYNIISGYMTVRATTGAEGYGR